MFIPKSRLFCLVNQNSIKLFLIQSEPPALSIIPVPCSISIADDIENIGFHESGKYMFIFSCNITRIYKIEMNPLPQFSKLLELTSECEIISVAFVNSEKEDIVLFRETGNGCFELTKRRNSEVYKFRMFADNRWAVLLLASGVMFGNYYAYDLPASLNIPLQVYMNDTIPSYQYNLNLLYTVYSTPNIILPFVMGSVMDRHGAHYSIYLLSCCVVLGQIIFSIGISTKAYWCMHLGRFIFGIGGESLSVAQSRVTARWFRGKELAMALGMNLAIGRLGSVLNDLLSPQLNYSYGLEVAIMAGTISCILSFICGQYLVKLDQKFPMKPQLSNETIDEIELVNSDSNLHAETEDSGSVKLSTSLFNISRLPFSFWLICTIMCLYYAADIPFNTIHASFLQSKWYKDSPKFAAQVIAIPDTLSVIFVPAIGLFVDFYGHRCKAIILCGLLMSFVHFFFTIADSSSPSPIPFLVILGISYALLVTFWPCITLVVPENKLSSAFGMAVSLLNLTLAVTPVVVAFLLQKDSMYFATEIFFTACCVTGLVGSCYLYYIDRIQGGLLERAKEVKESHRYQSL